ncbi:hypothetical protein J7T55_013543 [Diaporthe amygdali]|uniref:uncharacterized protein n=1 Tax=Phomopsis amygdali TaxID=1214568 RepID=UPI0022FEE8EC|nr:uncharacterized protein J7T55_013543 [Diaporthe amygdali]KAJ0119305.1 hypothetical protein J7T55_013543 [Diaporthe amygdali]
MIWSKMPTQRGWFGTTVETACKRALNASGKEQNDRARTLQQLRDLGTRRSVISTSVGTSDNNTRAGVIDDRAPMLAKRGIRKTSTTMVALKDVESAKVAK